MKSMNKKYLSGMVLVVAIAATGLSSCGIRNSYKAPELNQNIYRDGASADTTSIATIPWKNYFTDAYLQALIDEGLTNSHDLKIAVTRIQSAEAALGQTKAAFFPDLTLVGQAEQKRGNSLNDKTLGYHNETYMLGVSASWEADIWGKLYKQKRGAVAQYMASEAYRNLIQTSLVSNIAVSYYSLMALDEQLKVTKESITLLDETVGTMEALKEAAIMNGAAVEQSKAALYATQVTVPDLENQIRKIENSICVMLGREPGPIVRSNISQQRVPTDIRYGVPAQMLARRPDVKLAEYTFRAAFEATGVAQASLYPSISLSATLGYSTVNGFTNFFKPENLVANLLGNLAQPIFAKKQLTARLKMAKAQQEEALISFEKAVLEAGSEVSNTLYSYEKAVSKNEIRSKQVQALLTSVDFTKELLKSGDANYIEVLNAEQSLLQAQLGQVNDKLEQLQATVNLYRALGGGVE